MKHQWKIQEAKDQFVEVVEQALENGPQVITKGDAETVVLISYIDYKKLFLGQQKLSDFFRTSPLVGVELDLSRDQIGFRAEFANIDYYCPINGL